MEKTVKIKGEAKFTFLEATGVLLGHEVGAGILTIPFIASLNNWWDFVWILLVTFALNVLLHLMIAELSLNNKGAQFVECMRNELFKGKENKTTKIVTWIIFGFIALSVIVNCTAYITGAASVLTVMFNWPSWVSMLVYYAFAGFIVFFGMKIVGISEKISSYVLIGVICLFGLTMLFAPSNGFLTVTEGINIKAILGLYSIVSFAMSAVMSVPTVVRGLEGDAKKIKYSIILSELINICLIAILTLAAVVGAGPSSLNENHPASLDLGIYLGSILNNEFIGNAVKIFGYAFSIFAYSTSLWANTLNLRDIIKEQTNLNKNVSWVLSSAPALLIGLGAALIPIFATSLAKLSTLAGGIQVLTGGAIVISFIISRKKKEKELDFNINNTVTGKFGNWFWSIVVIISSLVATVGSIVF